MSGGGARRRLLRSAGRTWRRWTRAWRRRRGRVVYAREYGHGVSDVPVDPLRGELILAFLFSEGLLAPDQVHPPTPATMRALRRIHTDDYLESLARPESLTRVVGVELAAEQHDRFLALQRMMAGGTSLAVHLALERKGPVLHLGGGLHHAHADRGQGFCVLNDLAIAIAERRAAGFAEPVLIIDLDLHDGDGTRRIFALDPSVATFSISHRLWDDPDAVASTTLTLGDDVDDDAYLEAIDAHLPAAVRQSEPGLVIYVAATDPAADDEIGNWRVTAEGLFARDRRVWEILDRHAPEAARVVVLGGGYGSEAWRHSARSFAWILSGRRLEPPSTEVMTLARYRHLAEVLRSTGALDEPDADPDDWGISQDDLLPALASPSRPQRFLDYYSRHHMEVVLERVGLLDRLRAMGFARPTLELDLDNPSGHTLRIFADESRRELLAELRARVDATSLPDADMLRIEWLLLQNPRAAFPSDRPPLPGQRHPGLGMLRDAIALLILVCERLGLDGLFFVPSHYHLAATARSHLPFLDPEAEGRFRALRRALEGLSLAEATRAVEDGRVVDGEGDPVEWEPAPMILPVSDELRRRLRDPEREERAGAATRERYRLAVDPPRG